MRYNVKDITIFFHLLKNVNGIGGGFHNLNLKSKVRPLIFPSNFYGRNYFSQFYFLSQF